VTGASGASGGAGASAGGATGAAGAPAGGTTGAAGASAGGTTGAAGGVAGAGGRGGTTGAAGGVAGAGGRGGTTGAAGGVAGAGGRGGAAGAAGGVAGTGGRGGAAGGPPLLAGCVEYPLHASPSCTLGDVDDVAIESLAFSRDGGLLLTSATGLIKVWTLSGNVPVADGHTFTGGGFGMVAFSPNGSTLAVGWKGSVELWDVASWTRLQTFPLASSVNQIYDLGFSPDGAQLIVIDVGTSKNGNLYVFATASAQPSPPPLQTVALAVPWSLSVSPVAAPGGALAAVADQTGTVGVYGIAASTGAISAPTLLKATSGSPAYVVRFSPDGKLLAGGGGTDGLVRFWDVPIVSTIPVADIDVYDATSGWSDDIDALAFSPGGDFIVVGGGFFGSLSTWGVAAPRAMIDLNESPSWDIASIAVSTSGMIAAGESDCGRVMICGH
jgi:WD40 repeat protein